MTSDCTCIHIDGVYVTPDNTPCTIHPCTLCSMRAGEHTGHVNTKHKEEPNAGL